MDDLLSHSVEDTLDFSVRVLSALQNHEVETIGDLVQLTEVKLLRCKNFGRKSLKEVRDRLREVGLHLADTGLVNEHHEPSAPLAVLGLNARLLRVLKGLSPAPQTIGDLVAFSEIDLLCLKGMGRPSLRRIKETLRGPAPAPVCDHNLRPGVDPYKILTEHMFCSKGCGRVIGPNWEIARVGEGEGIICEVCASDLRVDAD